MDKNNNLAADISADIATDITANTSANIAADIAIAPSVATTVAGAFTVESTSAASDKLALIEDPPLLYIGNFEK